MTILLGLCMAHTSEKEYYKHPEIKFKQSWAV